MRNNQNQVRDLTSNAFFWPETARRLWCGSVLGPQTRYFRRAFDLEEGIRSTCLLLYAEGRVHLWCNGHYLARGPLLHHPNHRNVQKFQLEPFLRPGRNVLAIAAHTPGVSLNSCVLSHEPGPVATLSVTFDGGPDFELVTDESWKCTDQTGWVIPAPRRGWALGVVDVLDAVVAPFGWQQPEFDDQAWTTPQCLSPSAFPKVQWQVPDFPAFEWKQVPVPRPPRISLTSPEPPVLCEDHEEMSLGCQLLKEPWTAVSDDLGIEVKWLEPGRLDCVGIHPGHGLALVFDMERETVGQIVFDCVCETAGVIDIAWSEVLNGDRPWTHLKSTSYVDRLLAKPGRQTWEPISYSGARYVCLILRGFTGKVSFTNLGMRATRLAVDCSGASFQSSSDVLNRIWNISKRTLEISPQDGLTDCPSREQSTYIFDSSLAAEWVCLLSGDRRLWRHTIREVFLRPGANGLLKDAFYSPHLRALVDFSLVGVILLGRYLRQTDDLPLARELLSAAEGVMQWFVTRLNSEVLLPIDWEELRKVQPGHERFYTGGELPELTPWLFIDHPGMGWHNIGQAGIDRSGINAAIHALLVLALESLAGIHASLGDQERSAWLFDKAASVRTAAAGLFFDPTRGVFADGVRDGKWLAQISQQTNTFCLLAGFCDDQTSQSVMERILQDDPAIAQNGTGLWHFLLEFMCQKGLEKTAIRHLERLWGGMLKGGATTVWETFDGDHYDSRCHPWSAGPVSFIARYILGLRGTDSRTGVLELRPRYDLLSDASGSLPCGDGLIRIAWKRENGTVRLAGSLPEGREAILYVPRDQPFGKVSGNWSRDIET